MTTIAIDARKLLDFGIGTYLRGLLRGLAAIDAETRYVLLGEPSHAAALGAMPDNFDWARERSPGYSVRELWSVSQSVRRLGADLFHAPHYVLPLGLPCPAVVTVHDLIHLRFPEFRTPLETGYARLTVKRALRTARRTIAVSEATRQELVERFGGLATRTVVVANGVDERFRRALAESELAAALARLDLAPGYLLFVGNPKPHKNLDALLAAHTRLEARRGDVPALVLAGGERARRLRAGGGVDRLGIVAVEDLPALYRGALALVVPSLWEGFGLPALEAMASGTPVVAADRGGLREVVGDDALRFDPGDVEALERTLERLLDDAELRHELARRGPLRAASFTWQATARATLAVYRTALAASREAGP